MQDMTNTERFLLSYGIVCLSTVVIFSFVGLTRIDVFVGMFTAEFFVLSELTAPSSTIESRRRAIVGILLLAFLAGILGQRVLQVVKI